VAIHNGNFYWHWQHEIWVTQERLSALDVAALINEVENKKRLRLQKARDLQAMADRLDERGKRQTIPRDVKTEHRAQSATARCFRHNVNSGGNRKTLTRRAFGSVIDITSRDAAEVSTGFRISPPVAG
jgi:hypothetical protein